MSDTYLLDLKQKISFEKQELIRLENFRNTLNKEINDLRTQKYKMAGEFEKFTSEQMKYSSDKIKESRDHLEDELYKNREEIRIINKKGKEVEKGLDLITRRLDELVKKEKELQDKMMDSGKMEVKSKSLMDRIYQAAGIVQSGNKKLEGDKKRIWILLGMIEAKVEKIEKYENEKRDIILEKEEILNHQFRLLKVKEELMDDGVKWVKDQKERIQAQWESLLLAKKYIEKHGELK